MEICFRINHDWENAYVCTEEWIKNNKDKIVNGSKYDILKKGFINSVEEMINYCLTYYIDINIPEGYKVTKIYNIVLSTGNFEPSDRTYSTCTSSIIFSTTDEKAAERRFKYICKDRKGLNVTQEGKRHFCWYGEDYASNQIVFSYDLNISYLVERIDK